MKNVVTALLFLTAFWCSLSSCKRKKTEGKGEIKTETRGVTSFATIDLSTSVTAVIVVDPAAQPSVTLKGYANILELIKTEVTNGTLKVYTDDLVHFRSDKDVVAEITVPSLQALEISGASDATIKGPLTAEKFNLEVSGAGDVVIENMTANTFEAELTGAGQLEVKGGSVNKLAYDVTGAGDISTFPLQSKTAEVTVTGMGDVELSVSDALDASITGAGDINYKGHPQLTTNITGGGSIEDAK
jgi:hypothetical protein